MMLPPTLQILERGWLSANNILFIGANETALVDTGYLGHASQTLALVRQALQGRALDRIVNTHLHSDHCGGNAILQRAYACRTTIPAAEAEAVRTWDEQALSFIATGQRCERFAFTDTMRDGDVLTLGDMTWQVHGAAGHDPHSVILYCPQHRILISADALWQKGFGVIFPELDGAAAFDDARATLETIRGLDIALVIPGHGAPFADVASALDIAFSRLDYLAADPLRNAQNGIKVLVKFLLLDRRQIALAAIPDLLASIPLVVAANERYLHMSLPDLSRWVVQQLVRVDAAEVVGISLYDRG